MIGSMFLGALFVVIGVLASAAADKIRGVKFTKERAPSSSERIGRAHGRARESADAPASPTTDAHKMMRADVIRALVQSGFDKLAAAKAVDECPGAVQSTLEAWTRAALKRIMAAA
jgi:hypothetical protein